MGVTFYGSVMDLLGLVIYDCCPEVIKLVSIFSAITISVWVSLLSKGDGDLLSHFEVVEASVSSVSQFLFNTFVD